MPPDRTDQWSTPGWRIWSVLTVVGSLLLLGDAVRAYFVASASFRDTWLYHSASIALLWLSLLLASARKSFNTR